MPLPQKARPGKSTLGFCLAALALCVLTACSPLPAQNPDTVQVVLEQSGAYTPETAVQTAAPGADVRFTLHPAAGYRLQGADYPGAALAPEGSDGAWSLYLPAVRYSATVQITAVQSDFAFCYYANDGTAAQITLPALQTHQRINTATGLFSRAGCTQTGWNTAADGSGRRIGLGSRADPETETNLYAVWCAWAPAGDFTYTTANGAATITGYTGPAAPADFAVPGELGGVPVTAIGPEALAGLTCENLILPGSLRRLESGALRGASLQTVTLFDSISQISGDAFAGCGALQTLYLNAAAAPVYSGSYYAAFADKYDRLLALKDERKLVLFSGSSTRFGYDSAALDAALPDYEVVNMGVFAYTNALPQLLLILDCMQPGDLLLDAPEFDAAKRQFCTTTALDDKTFCLMEANYDLFAALDLRELTGVFSALDSYLSARTGMAGRSYELNPADFEEDGAPTGTASYNEYGDYALPRPNAADDAPIYGLAVDYTVEAFPAALYLAPYNAVCSRFLQKGVRVYFTYAPRNSRALSAASTPAARAALDGYLRQNLVVPVISDLESSLYPGRYLYGTDNHLSTKGAALRTEQILADLTRQFAAEEGGGA